jgi:hypothetical protein
MPINISRQKLVDAIVDNETTMRDPTTNRLKTSLTVPYSYVIFFDDTQYVAQNGKTGKREFKSPDRDVVISQALNALASNPGVIYVMEGVVPDDWLPPPYTHKTKMWVVKSDRIELVVAGAIRHIFWWDGKLQTYTVQANNLTQGSVLFAGSMGEIAEDNANLFWDNVNKRLGVGTATPVRRLHIESNIGLDGIRIKVLDGQIEMQKINDAHDHLLVFLDSTGNYLGELRHMGTKDMRLHNFSNGILAFGTNNLERMRITPDGEVGIGTTTPTAKLDVAGATGYNQLRLRTPYTPTSSADPNGNVGDIAWDNNYIYVKTNVGWKRAALAAF